MENTEVDNKPQISSDVPQVDSQSSQSSVSEESKQSGSPEDAKEKGQSDYTHKMSAEMNKMVQETVKSAIKEALATTTNPLAQKDQSNSIRDYMAADALLTNRANKAHLLFGGEARFSQVEDFAEKNWPEIYSKFSESTSSNSETDFDNAMNALFVKSAMEFPQNKNEGTTMHGVRSDGFSPNPIKTIETASKKMLAAKTGDEVAEILKQVMQSHTK